MQKDESRISALYKKLVEASASENELEEFYYLADQYENEPLFEQLFVSSWEELERAGEKVVERSKVAGEGRKVHRFPLWKRNRWIAAASILIMAGLATYKYISKPQSPLPPSEVVTIKDIPAPNINRATITLSNGQKLYLDSVANGQIAVQGKTILNKIQDGQIRYAANKALNGDIQYNTLTNPRGSKTISLILPDGSKVWLNAESELKYPVAFGGKERKIILKGEAYFEVVHNPKQPFRVETNTLITEDMGTHFNVNAYDDESSIKVSLLEGAVNVTANGNYRYLAPGEQAVLKRKELTLNKNVDLKNVIAWKNGLFTFEDLDLKTILRQVSRWYDVNVEYKAEPSTKPLSGGISRDLNLQQLLNLLQSTGLHFELVNKTIIISK